MAIVGLLLVGAMPVVDPIMAREEPARSEVAIRPWVSPRADSGGISLVGQL